MSEKMETKVGRFEVKELKETGEFMGYAAVFNNVDDGGDLIEPGAFTKTLTERKRFPLTWFHDRTDILGYVEAEEDSFGLKVHGFLNMAVKSASEKYALLKQGAIDGMSFGFKTIKDIWDNSISPSVRRLKEVKLREAALVDYGMNSLARVTEVKSDMLIEDLAETIKRIENEQKIGKPISVEQKAQLTKAKEALTALLEAAEPDATSTHGETEPQDSVEEKAAIRDFFTSLSELKTLIGG